MKKVVAVIVVCLVASAVLTRHRGPPSAPTATTGSGLPARHAPVSGVPSESTSSALVPPHTEYACDGRVYCSQMTSCDEAKYFLAHCPGVKMDGDGDGIPCERQFCGS
jgi:hypothetical protein